MEYYWLKTSKILVGQVPKEPDDMKKLKALGIGHIISLLETDYELEPKWAALMKIKYSRYPIEDLDVPALDMLEKIHALIDEVLAQGECVYLHCFAGIGRAGTVAASYLVKDGMSAKKALETVRELRRGSVQTSAQELLVYEYEKIIKAKKKK